MSAKTPPLRPPSRSRGVLSDVWKFLLRNPGYQTIIGNKNEEERKNYNQRILQRFGIVPDRYSVLNIHRIGVKAPPSYVFNEILKWNGDSTCWPNFIARLDRIDDQLEHVRILPFGWSKYPFSFMKSLFGLQLIPLFEMNSIRFKTVPDSFDFDNARYLLYRCSGGYPIGFFSMYVRSSIAAMGEKEQSQLFIIVGFNFYGHEAWARKKLVNRLWESVHNRVTSNVLVRMKQLCEWRLVKFQGQEDMLNHFGAE